MKKNLIITLILFIPLICILSCTTTNPVTGEKQVVLLSEEEEKRLGEELYPKYTQQFNGLFQDDRLQSYVTEVGRKVASYSHRPNLNYEFNVVNSSEANAYALPGGKISITRGLISSLENEAQLASVFAHELGHISALHTARAYTRSVMAELILTGVGMYLEKKDIKYKNYYMLGGYLVTGLVLLKYSRDDEREADKLGIEYLAKADYDPYQFVSVMQLLKSLEKRKPHKFEVLFRSHPLTDERIQTALTLYQTQYSQYTGVKNNEEFKTAIAKIKITEPAYALFDKGVESLQNKSITDALAYLKDASGKAPDHAIIRAYYGRALYESGRDEIAYRELESAYLLYPDQFHIRLYKGIADFETARFLEAIKDLKRADELIPDQAPVQFFLAKTYEYINRREESAAYYLKFLKMVDSGDWAEEAKQKLISWGYLRKET
ncbi:MAG: M48 family metalloprotease [Candidatus Hydrogenedentota bacterium]